ncbi:POK9 protein, partial [Baryphthengus martii]|nr:POK9 protein [Baryphthengus martii]
SGRAGVDVETVKDVTLIDSQVQSIPTNMTGPLGHGLSALILGRSSVTRKGIFILPDIIGADFAGIISIMVWTLSPPVHIPKGSKIGQLVPFKAHVPKVSIKECAEGSFDSTDNAELYLALDISKAKPMEKVTILDKTGHSQTFEILVDTGADVTIIS